MADNSNQPSITTPVNYTFDEDTLIIPRTPGEAADLSNDDPPAKPALTSRFQRGFASIDDLIGVPRADGFPSGNFTLVPASMADKAYEPGVHRWWVELWSDEPGSEPIRLEIVGDVVLGRTTQADVDLHEYSAIQHGVSRRHAMLRPGRKTLYLLDLGSTNGTHFNGIPMGQGIAMAVAANSVIRLGKLNLTVRFLTYTD